MADYVRGPDARDHDGLDFLGHRIGVGLKQHLETLAATCAPRRQAAAVCLVDVNSHRMFFERKRSGALSQFPVACPSLERAHFSACILTTLVTML
jgi:hypothetical protein